MMNRRDYLIGVSGLTVGGLGIVGSGAFGSVDADRKIQVRIEDDWDSYLQFVDVDDNYAYFDSADQIEFRFDDDFPAEVSTDEIGDGIGRNSVYEFANVFIVRNHGTQPVQIFGIYEQNGLSDVFLLEYAPNPSEEPLTENSRSSWIEPGDGLAVSIVLDSDNVEIGDYSTSIRIVAAAEDSHVFS